MGAWAAEVLESHVSFPLLSFYRSQHDNQSWLAAMTVILDASALVIASVKENDSYQAQLTFAMARHAVVDLAQVYHIPPLEPTEDRMPPDELAATASRASRTRASTSAKARPSIASWSSCAQMYEPFVNALSRYFMLALPPVIPESVPVDNWQTSAWMRRTSGIGNLVPVDSSDDHVD